MVQSVSYHIVYFVRLNKSSKNNYLEVRLSGTVLVNSVPNDEKEYIEDENPHNRTVWKPLLSFID